MDSKKEIEAILSENTLQRPEQVRPMLEEQDRKSTRLNSSHT